MSSTSSFQAEIPGHTDHIKRESVMATPRMSTSGPSNSFMPGLVWQDGQPVVRFDDAVVETVVTHVTRTTTSFAPIPLPRIPQPRSIPLPKHLSPEQYPLAHQPVPEDMKFFALNLGGQRVIVKEDEEVASEDKLPGPSRGPGWVRHFPTTAREEIMGFNTALNSSRTSSGIRKRPYEKCNGKSTAPTPPETTVINRTRSPPRKRVRGMEDIKIPIDGTMLSPLPSPELENPPSLPSTQERINATQPNMGNGIEMATLFSLPSIISHFENLPDKLQEHVLMHLFRRTRLPSIQRLTAFAKPGLQRDIISYLPHELAVNVLKKVDSAATLAAASRVCKNWKRIIDSERTIWRQRLIDDDLYIGLGVEEEDEAVLENRIQILSRRAQAKTRARSQQQPLQQQSDLISPVTSTTPIIDPINEVPLKHVYRRRIMANKNWLERPPQHHRFAGHGTNVVTCTQFDKDKIITASDDHSILVYDLKSGRLRKKLEGHNGGVWALEFIGNTLVTGSTDRTVKIWDLKSFKELQSFEGHNSTVRCLQIVEPVLNKQTGKYEPPYPLIVTGSRDSTVRVWKLPKRGETKITRIASDGRETGPYPQDNPYHIHLLEGHTQAVRAITAHGRLCMSASYDCTIKVWDIIKGTCLRTMVGHEAKVYSVVYDRYRNRCASGSMDNTVRVWDVETGQCLKILTGHTSLVGLLEISPKYVVSAAADASLRIWDADTYELKDSLTSHGSAISCFAHDENKVISGSDGSLKLWNVKTAQTVRELSTGITSVWQVVFKDNLLVVAMNRNNVTIFEVFDFGKLDHCSGIDDDSLDVIGEYNKRKDHVEYQNQNESSRRNSRRRIENGIEVRSVTVGKSKGNGEGKKKRKENVTISHQYDDRNRVSVKRIESWKTATRRSSRLAMKNGQTSSDVIMEIDDDDDQPSYSAQNARISAGPSNLRWSAPRQYPHPSRIRNVESINKYRGGGSASPTPGGQGHGESSMLYAENVSNDYDQGEEDDEEEEEEDDDDEVQYQYTGRRPLEESFGPDLDDMEDDEDDGIDETSDLDKELDFKDEDDESDGQREEVDVDGVQHGIQGGNEELGEEEGGMQDSSEDVQDGWNGWQYDVD